MCLFFISFVGIAISLPILAAPWPSKTPLMLSKQVYRNADLPFKSHVGKGKFDNYLAMTVNYDAVKPLFVELEKRVGSKLKHRGEAHITVVTPVEYHQILKPFLSMQTINNIAKNIQASIFSALCIGSYETQLKQQNEQTYYVVVKSDDLNSIRQGILHAFVKAGGKEKDFNVKAFYPHITLGFSTRDLHLSDGAKKDYHSCTYPISVQ